MIIVGLDDGIIFYFCLKNICCYVNDVLGIRGGKGKEKEREVKRDFSSKLFVINKNILVNY